MVEITFWQFFENFSKQTTIHGVSILGKRGLHPFERVFWLIILSVAGFGSIALSLSNWRRYAANPTVVSLQKDFRNWYNPFPAATACFLKKSNAVLVEKYIFEKWNVHPNDTQYEYYVDFVNSIANLSYHSLDNLQKFKSDETINDINMMEVAAKVHPHLAGTLLTFDTKAKTYWKLFMSEFGICFAINSKFVDYFTYNIKGLNVSKSESGTKILKCHYLNGLCYARYDSDPLAPLKFYIHSYLEIAHETTELPLLVKESEEMETNYRMQETIASPALRQLTPSQRRCRFYDEPISEDSPFYSTSMCHISCRYKLAMKLCRCRPVFYQKMAGKVCNISGLLCVAKHAEYITRPPSKLGCNCPQPCHIISYLRETHKVTKWEYGYFDRKITFRWGLLPPTTKYRRDVLFGFDDLVVSFGGTMALFLGVSFISVMETVFLILESVVRKVGCFYNKNRNNKESILEVNEKVVKIKQYRFEEPLKLSIKNKLHLNTQQAIRFRSQK